MPNILTNSDFKENEGLQELPFSKMEVSIELNNKAINI